jgi:hypothetical protein
MLDQVTPADIDRFWAAWKPARGWESAHDAVAFFRFCVNRKWIPGIARQFRHQSAGRFEQGGEQSTLHGRRHQSHSRRL